MALDRAEKRRIHREDAKWVGKPLLMGRGAKPFEANVRHLVGILGDQARPQRGLRGRRLHPGALTKRPWPA